MKFDKYKWMWWTNTEINRNRRKREAQSLINKQNYKSINKKNICVVAVT